MLKDSFFQIKQNWNQLCTKRSTGRNETENLATDRNTTTPVSVSWGSGPRSLIRMKHGACYANQKLHLFLCKKKKKTEFSLGNKCCWIPGCILGHTGGLRWPQQWDRLHITAHNASSPDSQGFSALFLDKACQYSPPPVLYGVGGRLKVVWLKRT